jgi:hypothetical protein
MDEIKIEQKSKFILKNFQEYLINLPFIDWLLENSCYSSKIFQDSSHSSLILTNGLISREFSLSPDCGTICFDNLMTKEAIIRGIKPEGLITLNQKLYTIGGLTGQKEYAYLKPEWISELKSNSDAFHLSDFEIKPIEARFSWKQSRWNTNSTWPPTGIHLVFHYLHSELPEVELSLHYEIYDGIPLLSKWMTLNNRSPKNIHLSNFKLEILAMVEQDNIPQGSIKSAQKPNIYFESDYAFEGMTARSANHTIFWEQDPQYSSQVAYLSDMPIQLECRPPVGPDLNISPNKSFESFRLYELVFDSTDRERQALTQRKMYRLLAPWITENPIFMHIVHADPVKVKYVIDQCVEVGFEMVILSFGSGLNMEWDDPEFFEEYRELFDYAHSKGIEIGSYSLFSSRTISPEVDIIDPKTGEPSKCAIFGKAPCLASKWGLNYLEQLKTFISQTHADFLEHDGPYPGDFCASTTHPGHKGFEDSQWTQWRLQSDFYKYCRTNGIYVNAPDWYFLSGSNKTGIGYKEVNWSLPRERQVIIARQNIYDGTWEKTPSMGWMFTPLTVYHMVGDYKQSTLEPLDEFLSFYETHLAQNFGAGVQSCYRGLRLFDTERTKAVVKKWVDFYKDHREILNSDLIHIRRPDGRHIDGFIHVNPKLKEKGLLFLFNPLDVEKEDIIQIPLYYTGLTNEAIISETGKNPQKYSINRNYIVILYVKISPNSWTWFLIE